MRRSERSIKILPRQADAHMFASREETNPRSHTKRHERSKNIRVVFVEFDGQVFNGAGRGRAQTGAGKVCTRRTDGNIMRNASA
jgi:hypothetical protein